ncbi:MAG: methionyl-tRNA formyltransferase, partial [Thermomicrobiales bacterium]
GRGRHILRSAVHAVADDAGLPLFAPDRLHGPEVISHLAAVEPSLFVVAAYGKILRPEVLALPDHGTLNVHASLLPAYRGASPVHAALLDGIADTGVSIMLMDVGLDTGPVLARVQVTIDDDATAESLTALLAEIGAPLLVETAIAWTRHVIVPVPQDEAAATITHRITKEDGNVPWERPAARIARMERAYWPWPGVFTFADGKRLLLHGLRATEALPSSAVPGTILAVETDGLRVRAGEGDLLIASVQPEGKSPIAAAAFARGHPGLVGMHLSRK